MPPTDPKRPKKSNVNWAPVLVCSFAGIFGRVGCFILSPLWQDSVKPLSELAHKTDNGLGNISSHNALKHPDAFPSYSMVYEQYSPSLSDYANITADDSKYLTVSPFFVSVYQQLFTGIMYGIVLGACALFKKNYITEADRKFPLKTFAIIGISQGFSFLMGTMSLSGTRTAPYLIALLGNFNIPITFLFRFLLLRRRPNWKQALCAAAVLSAEIVCLLPTIDPGLEPAAAREREGGQQHGPGRVLWPMCFVASQIPFAIANIVTEKGTKDGEQNQKQVNILYFLFGSTVATFLALLVLFWVNLIPGIGGMDGIVEFGRTMYYNFLCTFGGKGCGSHIPTLVNIYMVTSIMGHAGICCLIRCSEGANFTILVMTIRTPLLLLFWTLFQETPFQWSPHSSLSTWLSFASLFIMLPGVVLYNRFSKQTLLRQPSVTEEGSLTDTEDERSPLLNFSKDERINT